SNPWFAYISATVTQPHGDFFGDLQGQNVGVGVKDTGNPAHQGTLGPDRIAPRRYPSSCDNGAAVYPDSDSEGTDVLNGNITIHPQSQFWPLLANRWKGRPLRAALFYFALASQHPEGSSAPAHSRVGADHVRRLHGGRALRSRERLLHDARIPRLRWRLCHLRRSRPGLRSCPRTRRRRPLD